MFLIIEETKGSNNMMYVLWRQQSINNLRDKVLQVPDISVVLLLRRLAETIGYQFLFLLCPLPRSGFLIVGGSCPCRSQLGFVGSGHLLVQVRLPLTMQSNFGWTGTTGCAIAMPLALCPRRFLSFMSEYVTGWWKQSRLLELATAILIVLTLKNQYSGCFHNFTIFPACNAAFSPDDAVFTDCVKSVVIQILYPITNKLCEEYF